MPNEPAAAGLTILGGNHQRVARTLVDERRVARFEPLRLRVTDAAGRPLAGVEVRVEEAAAPPSMYVLLVRGAIVASGADGIVSVDVHCYDDDGPFKIVATTGRLQAVFDLTVAPPALADGSALAIVSGNHQRLPRSYAGSIQGGIATFEPLVVCVTDRQGNPVPDVEVGFRRGASSPLMAVQIHPSAHERVNVVTGADGHASLQAMHGKGVRCYYGDGPFTVVASAGDQKVVFELTVEPSHVPVPSALTIVAGDGQKRSRVRPGSASTEAAAEFGPAEFAPLKVRVTDADGAPLAGQVVEFARGDVPRGMAMVIGNAEYIPKPVSTGEDGIATLGDAVSVRCYHDDGPFTVVASLGGLEAVFHLEVDTPSQVPHGATMSILAGNAQCVPRTDPDSMPGGVAQFEPLIVRLTDAEQRPLAGVEVAFAASDVPRGLAVQIHPGARTRVRVLTGDDGIARLAAMQGKGVYCYYADGPFTVSASAGGAHVSFALTVVQAPPTPSLRGCSLVLVSGDDQTERRRPVDPPIAGGAALFKPMVVRLLQPGGRPLAGALVRFEAHKAVPGMAVQIHPSGASPVMVRTDADGIAALRAMSDAGASVRACYEVGRFTVQANVQDGPTISFRGEVLPG